MINSIMSRLRDFSDVMLRDRKRFIRAGLIIAVILLAIVLRVNQDQNSDITVEAGDVEEITEVSMYVDIGGAVKTPGVYEVDSGTRLYEVIEKAGGLDEDADLDAINRAAFVEDGQKIMIPHTTDVSEQQTLTAGSGTVSDSGSSLININTASEEELKQLTGVGDVIAQRIVEYRSTTPFKNKEDIMSVKGIGNATYEKFKDQITV